ncbi:MAG TPA: carboxypeptidase-like regulatory domain-containing protein, partial [Chitinophagaceae bacterium]|nr:carboxypeptidase-like regulatory domain-containing protein [Chitinophagaceae bacterium]
MRKFLNILIILMLNHAFLFAQKSTITGYVKDEAGKPVEGASVLIKGTAAGVSANVDGRFTISAQKGEVLEISATNFIPLTVKVSSQNELTINLKRGNNVMEEVVVTALGQTSKKAKVGYATNTFTSETINRTANVNAFDGLAGKLPGAEISNTGGPGSSTKIILRGYGVI